MNTPPPPPAQRGYRNITIATDIEQCTANPATRCRQASQSSRYSYVTVCYIVPSLQNELFYNSKKADPHIRGPKLAQPMATADCIEISWGDFLSRRELEQCFFSRPLEFGTAYCAMGGGKGPATSLRRSQQIQMRRFFY